MSTHNDNSSAALQVIDQVAQPVPLDKALAASIEETLAQVAAAQELQRRMLKSDVDYGIIPGTPKPTLYKPGAEKLLAHFKLSVADAIVEKEDLGDGHVDYVVRLPIIQRATGAVVGVGVGSCSTREKKYARNQPYDIRNTVLKMAKKRALVDAALTTTAASHVFTQDLEDLAANGVLDAKPANGSPFPAESRYNPTARAPKAATPRQAGGPDKGKWYAAEVLTSEDKQKYFEFTLMLNGKQVNYVKAWDPDRVIGVLGDGAASYRGPLQVCIEQKPNPNKPDYPYNNIVDLRLAPAMDTEEPELGEPALDYDAMETPGA